MKCTRTTLCALLLTLICGAICAADQLQWNDRETSERAAQRILEAPLLITYCSACSAPSVDLWFVEGIDILPTPTEGLFEIILSGWRVNIAGGVAEWSSQAVDLAYVYVPAGKGRFRCLGDLLALPCTIKVPGFDLRCELVGDLAKAGSSL
ncbi:hypothetical protein JW848_00935 [Candidatus Bipolaricaulota bacterium]|nr:hypothetical protein [Candidatus Bipolaricaulota bacterium]